MRKIILVMAMTLSGAAQAEMNGADILQQEAARAQEIQRLQHQAELLKQRAEIAKYVSQIRESGGDLSDMGSESANLPKVAPKPAPMPGGSGDSQPSPSIKAANTVPTLVQIEQGRALFDTEGGRVYGRTGQTLPGGYRVVSVDMREGARLQKGGMTYDIDMTW